MSLSTSSSRALYLKILVAILVGMSCSMALIRLTTYLADARSENFLGRVTQAREALPRITQESNDLVMFFGSSMVQAGFSPRKFDRDLAKQGIEIKSFNFGFGGLNPLFQNLLARRIKEHFQQENRRLKLVLIEFNPFQTTTVRRNRARAIEDSYFGLLGTDEELLDMTLKDPEKGIRLFNIRYLRAGISAEMITSHFGRGFQEPPQETALKEDPEIVKKRRELGQELNKRFNEDYPDYVPSRWSYEWQGAGTIPEERSAETLAIVDEYYKTILTPKRMDEDRLFRIRTADIIDLHFEEDLVVAFIELVKEFRKFSDHVEIVLLPKNTEWIQCPPAAMARMQRVMDRIASETGVPVRNFQEIDEVTNSMFNDTTHLNRYQGAVAFTAYLIEQYAQRLR